MKKLKILAFRVGKPAQIEEIEEGLKAMQGFVGGRIEIVSPAPGIDLVCNEEGILLGLEPNRMIPNISGIIHGDFFLCTHDDEGESVSLTDDQLEFLHNTLDRVWAHY